MHFIGFLFEDSYPHVLNQLFHTFISPTFSHAGETLLIVASTKAATVAIFPPVTVNKLSPEWQYLVWPRFPLFFFPYLGYTKSTLTVHAHKHKLTQNFTSKKRKRNRRNPQRVDLRWKALARLRAVRYWIFDKPARIPLLTQFMSTAPRSCPHSRPPRIINELTNQPTHRQPFCDRIFMLSRTFLSFALPKAPAHVYTRLSNTVYGLPLSLFTFIHVHAFHLCEYVKFSPHLTEFATERRPSPPGI